MAGVGEAIEALGHTEFVLNGIPSNEAEFMQMFSKVVGATEYNIAILSNDPADWEGLTWSAIEAKIVEMAAAEVIADARAERDRLLAETDWWASSDLTMTQEQIDYRQALRDIPQQAGFPDNIIWPTKP
jgi:hypothetical protein